MKKQAKFGVGIGIIVVALGFLAWLGYGESKTYYHTIAELETLSGSARTQRMRVAGTVEEGSIRHLSGRIDFVLDGEGKALPVTYIDRKSTRLNSSHTVISYAVFCLKKKNPTTPPPHPTPAT